MLRSGKFQILFWRLYRLAVSPIHCWLLASTKTWNTSADKDLCRQIRAHWTHSQSHGVVSLMFCKLLKIFSWNLCIAGMLLLMRISSLNFVHVYKASAWNSHHKCFFWYCAIPQDYFGETLVKQSPGSGVLGQNLSLKPMYLLLKQQQSFLCLNQGYLYNIDEVAYLL